MRLVDALRLELDSNHPDIIALVGAGGKTSTLRRLAQEISERGRPVIATTTTHIGVHQIGDWPACIEVVSRLPLDQTADCLATYGQCLLVGPQDGERHRGLSTEMIGHLREEASRLDVGAIIIEADGSRMRPLKAPDQHEPVVPEQTTLVAPVVGLDVVGRKLDAATVHRPALARRLLGLEEESQARITPHMIGRLLLHPQGGAKNVPAAARFVPLLNKAEHVIHLATGRMIAHHLQKEEVPSLLTASGVADGSAVRERWAPVAVVVLAAGRSSRMGEAKQVVPVGGVPMVVRAVRTALDAAIGDVYLVCGAHHRKVEETVAARMDLTQAKAQGRLQLLYNADWKTGQASSVHSAIRAQGQTTGAILFMPVDQPFLGVPLLRRLVAYWRRGAQIAAPSVDGHVRGAPGLFDRTLWPELLAIEGDTGGRPVLQRHKEEIVAIPVTHDELRDIDRPDDLLH